MRRMRTKDWTEKLIVIKIYGLFSSLLLWHLFSIYARIQWHIQWMAISLGPKGSHRVPDRLMESRTESQNQRQKPYFKASITLSQRLKTRINWNVE